MRSKVKIFREFLSLFFTSFSSEYSVEYNNSNSARFNSQTLNIEKRTIDPSSRVPPNLRPIQER